MKKILTASLVAIMAVTAANADIASVEYVGEKTGFVAENGNLTTAVNALASRVDTAEGKVELVSTYTVDNESDSSKATTNAAITAALDTLGDLATKDTVTQSQVDGLTAALDGKQATITDLADIRTGAGLGATALQKTDIKTGGADGTVSVGGADVVVKGLGSAAYTDASAYATSAQGTKADTAVQPDDLKNLDNKADVIATAAVGSYAMSVAQADGVVTTTKMTFSDTVAANDVNAPKGGAVKTYVDNKFNSLSNTLGSDYQKLLKEGEAIDIDDATNTVSFIYADTDTVDVAVDAENKATFSLKDTSVTTAKIENDAVTTVKIADDAVTTDKIKEGAIKSLHFDIATACAAGATCALVIKDGVWSWQTVQGLSAGN